VGQQHRRQCAARAGVRRNGNNYSHPIDPTYLTCIAGGGTAADCSSPDNHVDSILALNATSGAIIWAKKFVTWSQPGVTDGTDDWNVDCAFFANGNCPTSARPGSRLRLRAEPDRLALKVKIDTARSRAVALVRQGVPKNQLMAQFKTDDLGWRFNSPAIDSSVSTRN
jgi:hypothetical protein